MDFFPQRMFGILLRVWRGALTIVRGYTLLALNATSCIVWGEFVIIISDQIEALEPNLTLKAQELASCEALHLASKQLQTAAEKEKQACETTKQYLQKQL